MCVQGQRSLVAKEMPVPWAAATSTATGLSLRPAAQRTPVKADPNFHTHLPINPAQTQPQGQAVVLVWLQC